jgi:acid phosphatase
VLRLVAACACALTLGGASGAANTPTSRSVSQSGDAVRFLAIGDFGVGLPAEARAGAAVRDFETRRGADLLVLLGDNDYTRSPATFRMSWRRSFGWAAARGLQIAGVVGNHDYRVDRGRYQFRLLGMPRSYYTRVLGDVQFFLLNSNVVDDRQTAWLERALAGSTATWKIAVFHHPAYTCGVYSGNAAIQARWVPLFARYGVKLVLSGHDHNYQRFRAVRTGITYLVHGGGGAHLYRLRSCPRPYPKRLAARFEHGFLYFSAGLERLDGYAVNMSGQVTDRFSLTASG